MAKIAVMIGLGQLGRVFAGGLLKTGHVVVPVNRGDDLDAVAARWPEPVPTLTLPRHISETCPALARVPRV